jgi:hypothetical protein
MAPSLMDLTWPLLSNSVLKRRRSLSTLLWLQASSYCSALMWL